MTAALKELLDSERIWCIAARVAVHDGEDEHFGLSEEGHVELSVVTLRHGVEIKAFLKGGDDDGSGIWFIPSVGTEVIVNFDDGEFEGDAYVVAIVGEKPGGINLQPGKMFVIGDSVEIRSANGTAIKLPTLADVQAMVNVYNLHTHPDPASGFTGTPADASGPMEMDDPSGTDVVKVE